MESVKKKKKFYSKTFVSSLWEGKKEKKITQEINIRVRKSDIFSCHHTKAALFTASSMKENDEKVS